MSKKLTERLQIFKYTNDDLFGNLVINKRLTSALAKRILNSVWASMTSFSPLRGVVKPFRPVNRQDLARFSVLYNKKTLRKILRLSLNKNPFLGFRFAAFRPSARAIKKVALCSFLILKCRNLFYTYMKRRRKRWVGKRRPGLPRVLTYRGRRWVFNKLFYKMCRYYYRWELRKNLTRCTANNFTMWSRAPAQRLLYYKFWDSQSYFSRVAVSKIKNKSSKKYAFRPSLALSLRFSERRQFKRKKIKGVALGLLLHNRLLTFFGLLQASNFSKYCSRGGVFSVLKKSNRPLYDSLELRLTNVILRANFFDSPYLITQLARRGIFAINGFPVVIAYNAELSRWDFIRPAGVGLWLVYANFYKRRRLVARRTRNKRTSRYLYAKKRYRYVKIQRAFQKKPKGLLLLKRAKRYLPLLAYPSYMEVSFTLFTILILENVKNSDINLPFALRELRLHTAAAQFSNPSLWVE